MAAVTTSSLHLYSLTIQPPSLVTSAVVGNFAGGGARDQLILTATGSRITLYRTQEVLAEERVRGTLTEVLTQDVFAVVRSLGTYKVAGSPKEYLVIGSDAGRISTFEYMIESNRWQRHHLETFGHSGVRRAVPGQFLAVDPRGRACMLASVEKNKIIYFLNRDSKGNLTISSPLEAHKTRNLNFDLIALDTGYENPTFAALEFDYTECDQDPTGEALKTSEKVLVYYELDLGLNHVTRKWEEPVERTAHRLFQVPGGKEGPGGVLVCGENVISYCHEDQPVYRVPIPRRRGPADPTRTRHIIAGFTPKAKGQFFVILQSNDGDMFKVTLDLKRDEQDRVTGEVQQLNIQYFATAPVSSVIILLKSAYMFCASESGEHRLYAVMELGEQSTAFSSVDYPEDTKPGDFQAIFDLPPVQTNVELQSKFEKTNPITSSLVAPLLQGEPPQIITACGTGARSSLKMIKHGLQTDQQSRGQLSGAGGIPSGLWVTKVDCDDIYDSWVVLAYPNSTLTLQLDPVNNNIEEVEDAGFLARVETIAVQLLTSNSMVQVHSRGLRVIKPGQACDDWEAPNLRTVVAAATNPRQVALALSSGEVYYFELEDENGTLVELEDFHPEMPGSVTALSFGPILTGEKRSPFLAVGCDDETVRMLTTNPVGTLDQLAIHAVTAVPVSLHIMLMSNSSGSKTLYLHIGLRTGVYIRTVLDDNTAKMSNSQTRYLGPRKVSFAQVTVNDQPVLLAMSARTWLIYPHPQDNSLKVTPLNYEPLDFAHHIQTQGEVDGIAALVGPELCFINVPSIANHLITSSTRLQYTPRGLAQIPSTPHFIVLQSDQNTLPYSMQKSLRDQQKALPHNGEAMETQGRADSGDRHMQDGVDGDQQDGMVGEPLDIEDNEYAVGYWASRISIVDPLTNRVLEDLDLDQNECATACCFAPIDSQDGESFLFVATGQNMSFMPRAASAGYIRLYRVHMSDAWGTSGEVKYEFEYLHSTKFECPPTALCPFQGRLLVGFGRSVSIYDVGMRQLLRKTWNPEAAPTTVMSIHTQGSRVIISDQKESITYLVYDSRLNELLPFVDDYVARWSTAATMVDYETVAAGDKFGNLFVVRCEKEFSDEADQENGGLVVKNLKPNLGGAPHKLELACHFYLNDIPTGIHKTQLQPGGMEVLVWTGLSGTLGAVVPFAMQDEIRFFMELERSMRVAEPNVVGRDHLLYRSYYVPVRCCVDGDLCERFMLLSTEWKQRVSHDVEKPVHEIERKILDMRARSAF